MSRNAFSALAMDLIRAQDEMDERTLAREAAIARGIDAAAEMKKRDEREDLSEQCCGTCLFWDRKNEYTDRARCLWDKPVAFPVSFTRQLTYVEFGNDCPCWQDYKGIVK